MEIYSKSYTNFANKERERLEGCSIGDKNKELIKAFLNYLGSKGSGAYRQAKLSFQLRKIAGALGKDLDHVTRQDIQRIVNLFNDEPKWSKATKSDYRRAVKQFYKWFKDEDQRLSADERPVRESTKLLYNFLEKDIPIK